MYISNVHLRVESRHFYRGGGRVEKQWNSKQFVLRKIKRYQDEVGNILLKHIF
jgi:hypothetical protein